MFEAKATKTCENGHTNKCIDMDKAGLSYFCPTCDAEIRSDELPDL